MLVACMVHSNIDYDCRCSRSMAYYRCSYIVVALVALIDLNNGRFHLNYYKNKQKCLISPKKVIFISLPVRISVISVYRWSMMLWLHWRLWWNRWLLLLMIVRLCWWIIKTVLIAWNRTVLFKSNQKQKS